MRNLRPVFCLFVLLSTSMLFMGNLCSDDVEAAYLTATIKKNSQASVSFEADDLTLKFQKNPNGMDTIIVMGEKGNNYIKLMIFVEDVSQVPEYSTYPITMMPGSGGTFYATVQHYLTGSSVLHGEGGQNGEVKITSINSTGSHIRGDFHMELVDSNTGDTLRIPHGFFYLFNW